MLAAGAGRRMGRPKALVTWNGEPLLAHVARSLEAVREVETVCVVLGAAAAEIRATIPLPPHVRVAVNESWEYGGMLSSILTGLRALEAEGAAAGGLLVWPVDHPAVRPSTVAALVRASASEWVDVAVPAYHGRRGHPVLFGPATYEALASAPPDEGARSIVRARAASRLELPVDDPGVVTDLDWPADLEALERRLAPLGDAG